MIMLEIKHLFSNPATVWENNTWKYTQSVWTKTINNNNNKEKGEMYWI